MQHVQNAAFRTENEADAALCEAIDYCQGLPWTELAQMGIERRVETSYYPGQTIVIYPPYPALRRGFNELKLFDECGKSAGAFGGNFNLYAHIPFCTAICTYCSYARTASSGDDPLISRYVDALCHQRDQWVDRLTVRGEHVSTIFIGGGTPTILSATDLGRILSGMPRHAATEITVETDPDMITREDGVEKLERLRERGVNRISMGVETFDDAIASRLKRRGHKAIHAALANIRRAGIDNINIDLIYGLPGQSLESWLETLRASIATGVASITAYNYKLKPGSIDFKRERLRHSRQHEDYGYRVVVMQRMAKAVLAQHGYANSNVNWYTRADATFKQQREKYSGSNLVGLGPSTYSFAAGAQFLSTGSLRTYLDAMNNGEPITDRGQLLDQDEQACRRVVFGLKDSFVPDEILTRCSPSTDRRIRKQLERLQALDLIKRRGNHLSLSDSGVLFANELCTLFYSPDVLQHLQDSGA